MPKNIEDSDEVHKEHFNCPNGTWRAFLDSFEENHGKLTRSRYKLAYEAYYTGMWAILSLGVGKVLGLPGAWHLPADEELKDFYEHSRNEIEEVLGAGCWDGLELWANTPDGPVQ